MSVMCSDCPCRDTYAAEELLDYACNLYPDLVAPPAICTANPVLKILAEAAEIKEFETWEGLMRLDENGNDLNEGWQKVEFWIRREGE